MLRSVSAALAVLVIAAAAGATAGCHRRPRAEVPSPAEGAARAGLFDATRLARIDDLVEEAIASGQLPGAVVLVGHGNQIVYRKASGHRVLVPLVEPMTLDTIFDVASLTKVVATATSVMLLVEEGRLRLRDRVADHIPGFERYGKGGITIQDLLTHYSGLRPDLELMGEFEGHDEAIRRAIEEVPRARPGERFIYSDINFFLLGEIVARAGGMPLARFARERIFEPLGMRDTMFDPPETLAPRIAPTERCFRLGWPCGQADAPWLRGLVHDPTARRMGGAAGHAGLFSTADDLAAFCRMLLAGGRGGDRQVLSPLAVARMTSPASPPGARSVRGLGWDMDTGFSVNRGELFPPGSFGHTGFTGGSIWIAPATRTFVVFLSNRVHPEGKGDVTALRGKISTIVASALQAAAFPVAQGFSPADAPVGQGFSPALPVGQGFSPAWPWRWSVSEPRPPAAEPPPPEPVLTGIDVLRSTGFAPLRGRRVGLVTNHAGRARDQASTIDLLHAADGVQLAALFSPEHGIRGTEDREVASSVDEKTGLPIHSLYGETRRPTRAMLDGLDAIVIDLPDIGARFYTYMTTMAYVMEAAAAAALPVVVLDRPNPINGFEIEGPMLDAAYEGFTGYYRMPVRHGMTMGELARLFNTDKKIGAELTVVEMKGWRRDLWFDQTGQPWINPSPNMRNMTQAALYPGIGAIEGTNLSVGRGTDAPFEQIGAPWIDGVGLAADLNARGLAGIRFYPVSFTPSSSKYAGERCHGVYLTVTDRAALRPVRVGLEIAAALVRRHGAQFDVAAAVRLLGSREAIERLRLGEDPEAIAASWRAGEERWRLQRAKHLVY